MNFEQRFERLKSIAGNLFLDKNTRYYRSFSDPPVFISCLAEDHFMQITASPKCSGILVQEYIDNGMMEVTFVEAGAKYNSSKNAVIRSYLDGVYVELGDKILCKYNDRTRDYLWDTDHILFVFNVGEQTPPLKIQFVKSKSEYWFRVAGRCGSAFEKSGIKVKNQPSHKGHLFEFIFPMSSGLASKRNYISDPPLENEIKKDLKMEKYGNPVEMLKYIRENIKKDITIECPDGGVFETNLLLWGGALDAMMNFSKDFKSSFSVETMKTTEDVILFGKTEQVVPLQVVESLDYHCIGVDFTVEQIKCHIKEGLNHDVEKIRKKFWDYQRRNSQNVEWYDLIDEKYAKEFLNYISKLKN